MVVFSFICGMMAGMKFVQTRDLNEVVEVVQGWLADIVAKYAERDEALVVGLSGHLGAGKTAFVKKLAQILGVAEEVTSPTFVIMKMYETKNATFPHLVHMDAYRLERPEELEALAFEALVADKRNLIMIEWPENIDLREFEPGLHLHFDIQDGSHHITIK